MEKIFLNIYLTHPMKPEAVLSRIATSVQHIEGDIVGCLLKKITCISHALRSITLFKMI